MPKSITIPTIVILLILTATSESSLVKWPSQEGGNDHFYDVILVPEGIDWESAKNAAMSVGGYLATITCEAENSFVYNLASNNPDFWTPGRANTNIGPWLGGFQPDGSSEPDGNWQWITGETFGYTNWAFWEPNNHFHAGYENCLHFLAKSGSMDSTWNDIYAYDEIPPHSFVLEIPEPATILLLTLGIPVLSRLAKK